MKSTLLRSVSLVAMLAVPLSFPTLALAQAAPKKEAQQDPVVATVNGNKILLSDVLKLKKTLPEKYQSLPEEKLLPLLVRELVDTALIDAAAADIATKGTPEQKKAIEKALARATKDVNSQVYLAETMKNALTNDKIQEAYKKIVDNFPATKERKVSHIVVKDKATAQAVIKALKSGQDFQKLAKAKSTDTSAQRGGMLGFVRKDEVPPEVGEAIFSVDVGSFSSEPVETALGWHVFKIEGERQAEPPSLEEAQKVIEEALTQQALSTLIEDLRSKAKVVFFDKEGKPLPAEKSAEKAPAKPAAPVQKKK